MNIKKKLTRNTLANYVGYFWKIAINFFLFPFVVHRLGSDTAGIWFLLSSVTSYFGILDLGIKPTLVRHIAHYNAKKKFSEINAVVSSAFLIFLGAGLLAGAGFIIVGYFSPQLFGIQGNLIEATRISAWIVGVMLFLNFPLSAIGGGVLNGMQRYDLGRTSSIFSTTSGAIAIVYLLTHGYGLVAVILADQITNLLSWVLSVIFAKKIAPYLRLDFKLVTKKIFREIFKFSGFVFITELASQTIYYADRIVIGIFLGVAPIVYYEAAYKLYRTATRIPLLLVSAIMPASSELHAQKRNQELKRLYLYSTKYVTAFFLLIVVPLIIFARPILVVWAGKDFGDSAIYIQLFLLYVFFTLNHSAAGQILTGMGKVKELAKFQVIIAIANLALSIFLIRKIGLLGVVLGTTIPFVVMEWFYVKLIFANLKVNFKEYWRTVLSKVYLPAIIPAVGLVALSRYFQPGRILAILLVFAINFVIYGALFYFYGLAKSEKASFLKLWHEKKSLFKMAVK